MRGRERDKSKYDCHFSRQGVVWPGTLNQVSNPGACPWCICQLTAACMCCHDLIKGHPEHSEPHKD